MSARIGVKAVEAEGFLFAVCGEETDPYFQNAQEFARENRLIPAALKTMRHDAIVVDIGANIGVTVSMTAAALPRARIVAVEPSPRARVCLGRTALRAGFGERLTIVQACMGAEGGEAGFHEGASACASHVQPGAPMVPMTTLDATFDALALPRIDMVKIDVEGWEIDVLRGGARALLEGAPLVIAEINTWSLNWNRRLPLRDMIDYLRQTFGLAAWVEDGELRIAESDFDFYALAWRIEQTRGLDVVFSHDHAKVRALAAQFTQSGAGGSDDSAVAGFGASSGQLSRAAL